jgi:hypothetical protein
MRRALAAVLAMCVTAPGAMHYVTVSGLGGEADYEQRFSGWVKDIDKILRGSGGDNRVHSLTGAEATRQKLGEILSQVAREATPEDAFVLMLIGHGSYDGVDYRYNLPGPDISAMELAALCDRVPAGRQLIVNMTSASGGSIAALQRPNRAVIAATKTGTEKNATVFARYWVEALRDAGADTDKNDAVSALEAFVYADRKTAGFYETQKRLATEHPVIEDTGKGDAVRAASAETGKGRLAAAFPVVRMGSSQRAAADPHKRSLLERKERLEQRIDQLKYDKAAMPTDEYRKRLSALLLELAQVQEEIDK